MVLTCDRIRQHSKSFNLNFHDIAVLQENRRFACEAHAGRRSGSHDIAGFERDEARQKFDQFGHAEDHLVPPVVFNSQQAARDYGEEKFRDFANRVDADEAEALAKYGTTYFDSINPYLRGLQIPDYAPTHDTDEIEDIITRLDSAIQKGSTPARLKVFRGLGVDSPNALNELIPDPAFLSVSLDRETAKYFARWAQEAGKIPVVLELVLPKGTKAAYVSLFSGLPEAELLLERQAELEIISIKKRGDTIYAKAKYKGRVGPDRGR